ncbi:MAG: glycosyltransferase family 4 protein [Candidatus Omnitrophota bacterium]
MNKKVVILLTNPLEMDNRVCNEAKALTNAGFDVVVYAWDRERRYSNEVDGIVEGIKIKRVLIKSSFGKGLMQLLGFMSFWIICFWRLIINDFDIVQCVDLNTLAAGFFAAKIKRKRIVYDSHEDFPAAMLDAGVKILSPLSEKVECFLIKRVNAVLTVSDKIAEILKSRGAKHPYVIPTTKPLSEYNYAEEKLADLRKRLGVEGKFIFLYLGLLYHHRNLLEIIDIFKNDIRGNTVFVIGGYGALEEDIKKAVVGCDNIKFIGRVLASEMSLYTKAADVIFAVNKSTSRNSNETIPNKLFEAIAASKPIIGANVGPLGEIIRKTGCGLAINPDDTNEVRNAVSRLSLDEKLYNELTLNALKAQKMYNWEKTSEELIKVYKNL